MEQQWRGTARLAGRAARASALVAVDRARDLAVHSLPRTPEELATPAVLRELLGRDVRAARLTGDRFESSNCQNFLVEVESGNGELQTLYAKLPARELGPRVFANALGFWALECTFCRQVAPHVPVRVPQVHAVAQRGSRFVLLLENLRELPGIRLFENRDLAAGATPEQARQCLSAFARLHAGFHGCEAAERERLLPMALHPYLPARQRAVTRALNVTAIDRAHHRAPELVSADIVATCRRAFEHWDALLDVWYGAADQLTLVHGDSHLANCFVHDADVRPPVGLLDFQGVHWSKGIRDVAYFLIHSFAPDLLVEHEASMIEHYADEMAGLGVELEPDLLHDQYRSFSIQALMVGAVAVGLGGFTERESTVLTFLQREVAAFERLEFASWLDRAIAAR